MVESYIFDVDGTLYDQKRMRLSMAIELVRHFAMHPRKIKELLAIYKFRKYRELADYQDKTIEELEGIVSNDLKMDTATIKETIDLWMFQVPLKYLQKHKRNSVIQFMEQKKREGSKIIIYSDYPAQEKIEQLGLEPDYVFYPSEQTFAELKPSLAAMEYIIKAAGLDTSRLTVIGDRREKDGASAALVGAKYIDVTEFKGV